MHRVERLRSESQEPIAHEIAYVAGALPRLRAELEHADHSGALGAAEQSPDNNFRPYRGRAPHAGSSVNAVP